MTMTRPSDISAALGLDFSAEQLAAITAPLEPGVIIAGAGSGKTTVMAARVVWLVGTGAVRPEQVLGLTFTRKAAAELSERIRAALVRSGVSDRFGPDDAGEQLVLTYDAFATRLVNDHGVRIGVDGDTRTITGAARWRLAARVVAAATGPFDHITRLRPDTVTDRLLELDASLTAHLVEPEALHAHTDEFLRDVESAPTYRGRPYASLRAAAGAALERGEIAELAEEYQRTKRSLGVAEFADQMALAAALARSVPEVSAALRRQFAVVLLDEYQDTSSAQAELLRALFSGADEASGLGHPVTAVGDPCQAIYGWRGAAASNITTFADTFPAVTGQPARAYALTVNRRSGQRILDAANDLAAPLRQDPSLAWEDIAVDLVAPPGTPPGDIVTAQFDTWPAEIAWLVGRVVAAHDASVVRRWSDMAVLTRRNEHIGALFAALRDSGVPVEIVGLGGLLDVAEVADVVAVLTVLADVTANPALVRILTGPRWAIGPDDLAVLGRRAAELAGLARPASETFSQAVQAAVARTDAADVVSLAEALDHLGEGPYSVEGRERLMACAAELRALRRHSGEPVTDVVRRVITALGLEVELALRGPDAGVQLSTFVAAVSDYTDVDGDGSLAGLLAYLEAERSHGVGLDQAVAAPVDAVKLMTIHKAKGLEWELVALPALADKVFPSDRATGNWLTSSGVLPAGLRGDADSVPQLAETTDAATKAYREELRGDLRRGDDRLAYVGVTRARQHLLASTHAWYPGLQRRREPSDYLNVLASHGRWDVREEASEANPLADFARARPWPVPLDEEARARRLEAAAAVRAASERHAEHGGWPADELSTLEEAAVVAQWDSAEAALVAEARAARRGGAPVTLPRYLSATSLVALRRDPERFSTELVRPMPRPPAARARDGVTFHRWLEGHFSAAVPLVNAALGEDSAEGERVSALVSAFLGGPYASRTPVAVEVPFALVLAGRVIRGRVDAVFRTPSGFEVVDWKTGSGQSADPVQLALYRVAWAEIAGVEANEVEAVFYDVLAGETIRPARLPGRAELAALLTSVAPAG